MPWTDESIGYFFNNIDHFWDEYCNQHTRNILTRQILGFQAVHYDPAFDATREVLRLLANRLRTLDHRSTGAQLGRGAIWHSWSPGQENELEQQVLPHGWAPGLFIQAAVTLGHCNAGLLLNHPTTAANALLPKLGVYQVGTSCYLAYVLNEDDQVADPRQQLQAQGISYFTRSVAANQIPTLVIVTDALTSDAPQPLAERIDALAAIFDGGIATPRPNGFGDAQHNDVIYPGYAPNQPPPPPPHQEPNLELNTILYGPPGTGKTFATTGLALSIVAVDCPGVNDFAAALLQGDVPNPPGQQNWREWITTYEQRRQDGRIAFTTFHQNYAYEDFVEGIRASVANNQVGYAYQDGVLKEIAYRALYEWLTWAPPADVHPNVMADVVRAWLEGGVMPPVPAGGATPRNYVLIIDEINRGNIARILGELITLLEPTKRATRNPGLGDQPLKVKLPYTREPFILPPNLYIIGTMNTADRSLIGLDVALRRRFSFVELRPCPELLNADVNGVNIQTLLRTINERIAAELDDEHLLGHAYFMGVDNLAKLADVMRDRVIPQLREYFHDRPEALIRILASRGGDISPLLELQDGRVLVRRQALALAARYTAIYA